MLLTTVDNLWFNPLSYPQQHIYLNHSKAFRSSILIPQTITTCGQLVKNLEGKLFGSRGYLWRLSTSVIRFFGNSQVSPRLYRGYKQKIVSKNGNDFSSFVGLQTEPTATTTATTIIFLKYNYY